MKRKNLFKIISAMLICILLFNSYDASSTIFAESEEWNYAEFYRIKGWGNIELKEQIDMLDVPKEYIIGADAEQLIKYVVNYPLLIDAYVYDNPEQGVEHIRNTCSALDELLKRDDALELINKALEDVSRYIDEDNIQGELAESVAEGFLKLLLQTEF